MLLNYFFNIQIHKLKNVRLFLTVPSLPSVIFFGMFWITELIWNFNIWPNWSHLNPDPGTTNFTIVGREHNGHHHHAFSFFLKYILEKSISSKNKCTFHIKPYKLHLRSRDHGLNNFGRGLHGCHNHAFSFFPYVWRCRWFMKISFFVYFAHPIAIWISRVMNSQFTIFLPWRCFRQK